MKQFSKIVFASMMGTFMALGFLFFISLAVVAGMAGSSSKNLEAELGDIKDNSVLKIHFQGPLQDHVKRRDLVSSVFNYDEPPVTGLHELMQTLDKAAGDERIKGVLLHFEGLQSGMANLENLRRALVKFKASGKFLMSYSEVYSEKDYVLASAADEVILYPKGFFEWNGLASKRRFLKNTMAKLDLVPQVFRVGKYKSAIEPFINEKMSEASREQLDAILSGTWKQVIGYASEKTGKSVDELNTAADGLDVMFAKDALDQGFVNLLASYEEVEEKLKELTEAEEKPHFVSWRRYYKELDENREETSDNRVAIVFASGGITSSNDDGDGITSKKLAKLIHKIRRDESVKAVVLRVNSPGGSALASDVIWTATQWLKDAKPLVTSFGNVAASGGYYMSAGSQYIFAESSTITGSIGVFGLLLATKKFWNENVGMTFDTAKTHTFADMDSLVRKFNPEEGAKIQGVIDQIYQDFLQVVTSGREVFENKDQTHEIAQGRVWLGGKAQEIGLVDEVGGLDHAIAKAAELANLTEYDVEVFPKKLSAFEEFIKQFGDVSVGVLTKLLPEPLVKVIKSDKQSLPDRVLMQLPFTVEMN